MNLILKITNKYNPQIVKIIIISNYNFQEEKDSLNFLLRKKLK